MLTSIGISKNVSSVSASPPNFPVSHVEERWFAVHTYANHEKRVASQCLARDLEHLLPLYSSVRRWKDRCVHLDLPLFPGYIFVRIALVARLRVLEVPGVVRLIGSNGQPQPLPEQEIEMLRTRLKNASRIEPHAYLTVGTRVRIVRGPLRGVEGILIRKKNMHRVVVTIDVIARSAVVEVDALDIEKIF
ncbi:MAG: UpxY family transcription antiterminator [Candidatus Acidiferrum sp.]